MGLYCMTSNLSKYEHKVVNKVLPHPGWPSITAISSTRCADLKVSLFTIIQVIGQSLIELFDISFILLMKKGIIIL